MRCKLPHAVQIGPLQFNVVYKNKIKDPKEESEIIWGQTYVEKREIEIGLIINRTREQCLSTLFHETLHAVIGTTGHSEILNTANPGCEEAIVITFENYFANTIDWKHPMWMNWKFVDIPQEEYA
mgnify:FL=1